jgi:hypothetical protein
MGNLIAEVYVIEYAYGYVEPVIYLVQPESVEGIKIHMFLNPFQAKAFISMWTPSVEITVSSTPPDNDKEKFSFQ